MRRTLLRRSAIAGSLALAVAVPAGVASAEPQSELPSDLTAAISRDLGIDAGEYLHRADVAAGLSQFAQNARAQFGDAFAGVWLDRAGRGVVGVTNASGADAVRLAATEAGFDVKQMVRSESQLQGLKAAFQTWLAAQPAPIASLVRSVGVNLVDNTLTVRTSGVAGDLRLPDFLQPATIVPSPAPRAGEPAPVPRTAVAAAVPGDAVAGGDAYVSAAGDTALKCSFGFNGADGSGHTVNISAGHCDPNRGAAGTADASQVRLLGPLDSPGPVVGVFQRTRLDVHDYSLIRITDDQRARFENNAVRVPGNAPLRVDGVADPVVGAPVCKSGSHTGFSCGTVTSVGQAVAVDDRQLLDGFSVNICALPGDSGGAIVTGTKALGVSSASSVADQPVCEIPNLLGAVTGNEPELFANPVDQILSENPGVRLYTR